MKELRVGGGRTFEMSNINEIYYVDEDNTISARVENDTLRLRIEEGGSFTDYDTPMLVNSKDEINFKLEKKGENVTLTATVNNGSTVYIT